MGRPQGSTVLGREQRREKRASSAVFMNRNEMCRVDRVNSLSLLWDRGVAHDHVTLHPGVIYRKAV